MAASLTGPNVVDFSLVCWNIKGKKSEKILHYLLKCKADLYCLQEEKGTLGKLIETGQYKCFYLHEKIKDESNSCIVYNINCFEVYTVTGMKYYLSEESEVPCALKTSVKETLEPWKNMEFDGDNKDHIDKLRQFAKADAEQRVCVVILQCTKLPSKPKIIVASCHVPNHTVSEGKSPWTPPENCKAKDCKANECTSQNCKFEECTGNCVSKKLHYANGMLQALNELGKALGYPVVVAGDFNCDLIKPHPNHTCKGFTTNSFTIPKYDPTIHRVICSGGNGNPCIDFFAYDSCGEHAAVKVSNVRAEIVWPEENHDFLNWDKHHVPQYQECLAKNSTLHQTPSDHDPLRATLTISNKSSPIIYVTYCDLEKIEKIPIDVIVENFKKLSPHPDFCIFKNVPKKSIVKKVCDSYRDCDNIPFELHKFTDDCFGVYKTDKFTICKPYEDKADLNYCKCTIKCHKIIYEPIFELVIFYTNGSNLDNKTNAEKIFEHFNKNDFPVLLVGGFYANLFRTDDQKVNRSKFEVPEYAPTMYRMTHPCVENPLHICRDFFTYKNPQDKGTTTIKVDDVHAETINPPPNLITDSYTVNYDLFRDNTKAIETLTATVTVTVVSKPRRRGTPPAHVAKKHGRK